MSNTKIRTLPCSNCVNQKSNFTPTFEQRSPADNAPFYCKTASLVLIGPAHCKSGRAFSKSYFPDKSFCDDGTLVNYNNGNRSDNTTGLSDYNEPKDELVMGCSDAEYFASLYQ